MTKVILHGACGRMGHEVQTLIANNDALELVAHKSLERKTGARGLRSIIEGVLQDIMFEAPSDSSIKSIIITEETVSNGVAKITKE